MNPSYPEEKQFSVSTYFYTRVRVARQPLAALVCLRPSSPKRRSYTRRNLNWCRVAPIGVGLASLSTPVRSFLRCFVRLPGYYFKDSPPITRNNCPRLCLRLQVGLCCMALRREEGRTSRCSIACLALPYLVNNEWA